jgi:transcriptional regulator with XRE-family HTH domain
MTNVQLSEADIAAISGLLKSARESRGDNLAEAAFKIALSPSQLRAIEAGDLRPFYSTGYYLQAVERYASYLGIALPAREPPVAEVPAVEVPEVIAQEAPRSEAVPSDAVTADAPPAAEVSSMTSTAIAPESQTTEISEPPSERESKTFPWGWVAFAIAGLITIGVLKESLEPAAVPAPMANESATGNAASSENKSTDSTTTPGNGTPTPSNSASAVSTNTPAPSATATPSSTTIPQAPTSPAPKAAAQTPLTTTGTSSTASAVANTAAASDGVLEVQVSTWVQIVKNNGEKTNIKLEPGQRIEFPSSATAAVVFGQPDKARMTIKGKPVNLSPFITQDSPPRGLVIISQIRE